MHGADSRSGPRSFVWLCVLWVAMTGFIAVTSDYYDLWFFFVMLFVFMVIPALLWLCVPIVAVVLAIKRFRMRRIKAALGWLLVPVSAAAVSALGHAFGDVVMFQIHKSAYERIVEDASSGHCSVADRALWPVLVDLTNCRAPVIVVIPWVGFLSVWHGVIYDASDEISKPPEERSIEWKASPTGKALQGSGAWKALGDHYYLGGGSY